MKKWNFFVVLILFLVSCGNPNSGSKSSGKEAGHSIVYNIHLPIPNKDDWEIMHMALDGTGKRNITNHPDVAWTYYAYKDILYFISDRDTAYRHYFLYRSDANGSNVSKVSNLRLEDSWMSSRNDGQEMIVSGREGKKIRFQLFTINLLTGEFKQLTTDTSAMYRDPCYSPDGMQIVLSYKKVRKDKNSHEELYLMDADGSNLRQLTQYPESNSSAKDYGYKAGSAQWHPTENFISYVSKQDGRNSIFAITPDGKKQWKLIENPNSEGWHNWSSDGNWLVFSNSDNEEKQYHISLMNWKTKEIKQLTDTTYKSQLGPVFIEAIFNN